MTTSQKKQALREALSDKYRKKKAEVTLAHNRGQISGDDLHMRHKFLDREEKRFLAEIDEMSYGVAKRAYEKLKKNQPQ